MGKRARLDLLTIIDVAGALLIALGAWCVYPASGLIVLGVALLLGSWSIQRGAS